MMLQRTKIFTSKMKMNKTVASKLKTKQYYTGVVQESTDTSKKGKASAIVKRVNDTLSSSKLNNGISKLLFNQSAVYVKEANNVSTMVMKESKTKR